MYYCIVVGCPLFLNLIFYLIYGLFSQIINYHLHDFLHVVIQLKTILPPLHIIRCFSFTLNQSSLNLTKFIEE